MSIDFPSREELKSRGYEKASLDQYDVWRNAHSEAQKLSARLIEVFGDPPRPRITLHVARGFDDEWNLSDERVAELATLDPEQHWMEVSDEAIEHFQEYFNFTDAEGRRFYFPAFLRHYLKRFPLCEYGAINFACDDCLTLDLLSGNQLAFVVEFKALCKAWEE